MGSIESEWGYTTLILYVRLDAEEDNANTTQCIILAHLGVLSDLWNAGVGRNIRIYVINSACTRQTPECIVWYCIFIGCRGEL